MARRAHTIQLPRRVVYFGAGFVPASIGVVLATAQGAHVMLTAFAGAIGLLLATAAWLPVATRTYWSIAALLGAGLAAIAWYAWHSKVAAGLAAPAPRHPNLSDLAIRAWLLLGPVLCAIHFLSRGRQARSHG
jgi:hypothetical protein